MTLDDLEVVMYQQWHQTNGLTEEQDSEIKLSALSGICYQCQQTGHKADGCPNKKPSENGDRSSNNEDREQRGTQFQGNCQNCDKQGHMERKCWLKEDNKRKRPQGYRIPNESTNLAVDHLKNNWINNWNNNVEYLLCGLTIPTNSKILLDPNIWITDMAASVHMMVLKEGLQGVHKATQAKTSTMGNGDIETTTEIGSLSSTIYDHFEMNAARLQSKKYPIYQAALAIYSV
jgi:hypothetical protein